MPTVKAFIFDCFGVIHSQVLGTWYKKHCTEKGFSDPELLATLEKYDTNNLQESDILLRLSKYPHIKQTPEEISKELDTYRSLNHELASKIRETKNSGIKTALLTNANHNFFEHKMYPAYPEFKDLFNTIVISSLIGLVKPDPEIYIHTLNLLKVKPEETVFVDDSETNVNAAIKLGITGHIYTDFNTFNNFLRQIKA